MIREESTAPCSFLTYRKPLAVSREVAVPPAASALPAQHLRVHLVERRHVLRGILAEPGADTAAGLTELGRSSSPVNRARELRAARAIPPTAPSCTASDTDRRDSRDPHPATRPACRTHRCAR